jgi:hypothetical protein
MKKWTIFGIFWGLMLPGLAVRAGEVHTQTPYYNGERLSAPLSLDPARQIKNEGGSNGAGLCVISSVLANGQYQGVPGLEGGKQSVLWRTAKSRWGGYSPDKLKSLVNEVMPNEKWASYYGPDTGVLDTLSRQGYPIGATMNTGERYGGMPISHMVSLVHYRKGGTAAVVDNNFPGEYTWMPASEYDRRWKGWGGEGWAWIWTRQAGLAGGDGWVLIAAALVAGGVLVAWQRGVI